MHPNRAGAVAGSLSETVFWGGRTARVARHAFTFWEPSAARPSTLLSQTRKATVAEPALRDHWQRDIHACSESTLSHPEKLRNEKSHPRCANPVDVEDSLWKGAEKVGEIGDPRVISVRIGTKSLRVQRGRAAIYGRVKA